MLLFNIDLRYLFVIMDQNDIPVDTGRKLNVHKAFRRRQDVFRTSYVRSIYEFCQRG